MTTDETHVNKLPRIERKVIGEVCIDTGTLVVGDPCHLDSIDDKFPSDGFSEQFEKDIGNGKTIPTAVSLMTGLGDGFYPVIATIGEVPGWGKRIWGIHIDFIPSPARSAAQTQPAGRRKRAKAVSQDDGAASA
jgi:hypothetical protein